MSSIMQHSHHSYQQVPLLTYNSLLNYAFVRNMKKQTDTGMPVGPVCKYNIEYLLTVLSFSMINC